MIPEVSRTPLPIDEVLPQLVDALGAARAAVLRAAPGAGKTTRVPPALAAAGRVVVLQPRRVAARAIARRIADEQAWTIGREVGWHVRFERRFDAGTRVLLVTEGMLTAYLDDDPLLSDTATVVLDEFHERSLHTDLGLAMVRQAWVARPDLRVLVMSATLDAAPVQRFLGDCPLIDVPGTLHPLRVEYAPGLTMADALQAHLPAARGDALCFLPGAAEIERAAREAASVAARCGAEIVPLYGSLDADRQDAALRPGVTRRIVMATNIAETSLTVPGVDLVVDTGMQKVPRYDAARAIDTLVLERVALDSANQRAGRAARTGPGAAIRLWDHRDRLRPSREPEVHRVDLSLPLLAVMAGGNEPSSFEWFDPPSAGRVETALALLRRLGAVDQGGLTALGRQLGRLPLHPRLGAVLLAGRGSFQAAASCALLSEATIRPVDNGSTACDLLPLIDRWGTQSPHLRRVADALQRLAAELAGSACRATIDDEDLCRALLAGYPDRVAKRRSRDSPRLLLASGSGATLGRECHVGAEWLAALDVTTHPATGEALVRTAAAVDPMWLTTEREETVHRFDPGTGTVKAVRIERYGALARAERPVAADAAVRTDLLADAWMARGPDAGAAQLLARIQHAGLSIDLRAIVAAAAADADRLDDIDLTAALSWSDRERLAREAPSDLVVPSGRRLPLEYHADGRVTLAVKLQELFGLAETPTVGSSRTPVTLELLAPNGRPVQTTSDLRSFWERTYPEVRKELRGRYPRHPWPEDPRTATPTHRTSRRR
jgi:ATP-dependent helicase HrpB